MKNNSRITNRIGRLAFSLSLAIASLSCAQAQVTLVPLGTYATGVFDEGAQEIVTHDPITQRLFTVNANATTVDVLDISDPSNPTLTDTIDLTPLGGGLTSVSVANGILAVAVVNEVRTDPGLVAFYNAATLALLKTVEVGALPDMLTFTPDKSRVLTANEGEPSGDYTIDPEGSVSIVDLSGGVENATVTTADFKAFNGLALPGIRVYGPGASVAQDLEPEYIAVSADSKTAWVTLQENNALAIVDILSATVTQLVPLGFKDHSLPGNGLDASDRDDDNDGISDSKDFDDDNDGVTDSRDCDPDNDGVANKGDRDDDNDGVADAKDHDTDNDGIVDSKDTDDDGDGIPDVSDRDDDNDGISDAKDPDDDNNCVPDARE